MNAASVFAVEVVASLALSALVLVRLQGRLQRVGIEVCGRAGGAEFWVAYMMMLIAPLMLARNGASSQQPQASAGGTS